MNELSKRYTPKEIEEKHYQNWEKSGFFNPDKLPWAQTNPEKTFVAIMAPPNITGSLHMGHALENTLIDVLVRQKRMQGYVALWIPGTDHAGIATQNVVEKSLKKQGIKKNNLGREKFIQKIWEWRTEYGDIILRQFRKLGISVDWSRQRFTLDENYQEAVVAAFKHYYEEGFIYQGARLINWCSHCQTALSDLELEHKEEEGALYYIKYPLVQASQPKKDREYIVVATTRPETMLGDTAVAVHPDDKRYQKLIGRKVLLPIVHREIPIIADKEISQDFGTGAVKITPAHALADFEISQRHHLPIIQVINEKGQMTTKAGKEFVGLSVQEARKKIIETIEAQKLLLKKEKYLHRVAKCYRCGTTIEPLISPQWFLEMKQLSKLAKQAVKDKKIIFHPKKWEKTYFAWLDNVRDWCISRQIWWGHKLPVFYCSAKAKANTAEKNFVVASQKPKKCPFCGKCEMKQSEEVLDTWFSSALWPFAVLGWPQECKEFSEGKCLKAKGDLKRFYPADIMTSAPEILHLWITRMIFSGMEFMGREPFRNVYIHPVVLTKEGKRMSKSLGTGIDPLELIEKYGADATRFGLLWLTGSNQALRFNEDTIIMAQKFANKVWNAARFILINDPPQLPAEFRDQLSAEQLTAQDKTILDLLRKTTSAVNGHLAHFRFDRASEALYNFFWHDFCDVYIEAAKEQIYGAKGTKKAQRTQQILLYVLLNSLKLLHPFMPFITEEIYQNLPLKDKKKFLMIEQWPN